MGETFESRMDELPRIVEFIRQFAKTAGLDAKSALGLELAADEAVSNIIKHSYNGDPGKIRVMASIDSDEVRIDLFDDGKPFNPINAEVPMQQLLRQEKKIGGYGLLLMRHFTDNIEYSYTPDGKNHLTLVVRHAS